MGTLWGARAGCAAPGAGLRRPRMCGIGAAEAVLHIRPGPASDGSAESCGNVLAFNAGEILPCAEGVALHMGARPLRTDILVGVLESCGKPRTGPRESHSRMCSTAARTGKSHSTETPLPSGEAAPRNRSEKTPARPAAALRQTPPGARPRPNPAGDRTHRTGPGLWAAAPGEKGSAPSDASGNVRADHCDRPYSSAFLPPRITLFLPFPNNLSRCVVLPDGTRKWAPFYTVTVSMHLQVRGAP